MKIWKFLLEKIEASIPCALLLVLYSEGSSPGRQGFKMAVAADGSMQGSIGGGIMEQKLVEVARMMIEKGEKAFVYKQQIHNKESPRDQSGMICSGEQSVLICPVDGPVKKEIVKLNKALENGDSGQLIVRPDQLRFEKTGHPGKQFEYRFSGSDDWLYKEFLPYKNVIYIIGGGHVGLAFSRMMALLDFYIVLFDDRPGLNTMEQNAFAHEKYTVPYSEIDRHIPGNENHYAVIMTFGYRSDKEVLLKLLDKPFKYLGMMGSAAKIEQLWNECMAEGIDPEHLKRVKAPIGLPIASKSPDEIALSIAAQIIQIKNDAKQV